MDAGDKKKKKKKKSWKLAEMIEEGKRRGYFGSRNQAVQEVKDR